MIQMIGLKKGLDLSIRGQLTVAKSQRGEAIKGMLEFCQEAVIISTCNRTEIYFNSQEDSTNSINRIFSVLKWDEALIKYIFHLNESDAARHLMEVVCGFHSSILGEEQILGQVKEAYNYSLEEGAVSGALQRLFQNAITCGKEFRTKAKIYDIPVSSASIVVNYAMKRQCKSFMVIGYGDIGYLAVKYLLSHGVSKVYVVVRNTKKITDLVDNRVKIMDFKDKNRFIHKVDCIISCTSAPHYIIKKEDICEDKKLLIFDLAVPRDVEAAVEEYSKVQLLDIDTISKIDDENKKLRKERMEGCREIIKKHLAEYEEWSKLRDILPYIKEMKRVSEKVSKDRIDTFINKSETKDHRELAEVLIKSTSDYYVNRAIEVLKEAKLEGSEEQCLKIVEKIFKLMT